MAFESALSPDPPPSAEEDDSLARSTKRIKDDLSPPPFSNADPPNPVVAPSVQKTFKDMLIDGNVEFSPSTITLEELMAAGSKVPSQAPMMANDALGTLKKPIPKAYIPQEIWQRLCVPWKNSLIIKLLGKRINYHLLSSRLSREWQTEGEFTVIDIGQGYYVAKFSSSDDCSRVLTGGPYKFFDHYLAVQPWEPNFQPSRAKLPKTAVWVHLYGVPVECFHEAAVLYLGNKLGRAIKVDKTTLLATRGEFARVCVEVDLNESLPSMIDLDLEGLPQSLILVKYEGLHKICFECGEFGHKKEACHYRQPQTQPQPATASASSQQSGRSSSIARSSPKSSAEREDIPVLVDNCMTYGSWMVAKRKPRKIAQKQNSHGDNIPIPSKGHGIEKGGNISKSSGPPKSVNQEQNINTNNRFGVIALEEETLVEMPHLGAPDSGISVKSPSQVFRPVSTVSQMENAVNSTNLPGLDPTPLFSGESSEHGLGGLWLCWKTSVQLSVIFSTSQAIHCSVCFRGDNIFLTFGYVRPTEAYKTEFWKHMLDWKEGHSGAWVLIGDFNDVASSEEISPRTTTIFNRAQRFRNRMASCGLMEMETLGCKFTWCRTRGGRVVLRERLDRVLINSDCQHRLQGAKAFNLPRTCSDHHPILLSLDTVASHSPINKPARFEAAWLSRPEFSTVFTQAWSQHANHLSAAINATGEACLSWGKSVFENIYRKKRLLKARITGIQNSPRYSTSSWLQRLEVSLLGEYQQVLYEEELLWFQKSRVDWIASGDRNTSFYHMSTMVRRNKNKIGALKIGGEWIMDSFALQTHVKTFFEELFARKETVPLLEDLSAYQPIISDADHASLLQLATLEEVQKALFSMKGLKSPGPDGISALFYQRHWDTVAGTFLEFVNQALLTGVFEPSLTKAYVALIPKEDSPDSIQKFRPISLLNVAYKVLSKIIVNRLRPHLQELVGPWQSSFVASRSTVDNIILTQEAVHSMNRLKGRKGAMMLKIDLHKAFDSVDWGFLQQVLLEFNIPHQLVKLIMFSVTSVQLGILWNGEPLPFFRPQRGLRQGDPLSPYLFILVMERLAHMIQKRVASRTWQPFKLSRGGVSLSHLFFADDLMLFAQASTAQLDIIMDCLNQFAKSSGLVLNLQKSKLFFSPNVHSAVANSLSARCDIPLTSNLGTYLGIPITHTRHSHKNYGYILEKVQRRLSNWKSANLSLAGRKILVQSVTASIPTYTMQTTLLPKTTCDSIDRLNRDFLWGSNSEGRKPHLVNWEVVCSEKKQGGLGLRSAWENNQAFVAKLGWRLLKGDKALWCKAIQTKYLRGLSPLNAKANPRCSFIWRGILQCCPLLQQGVRWRVETSEGINFWHDNWVGNAPLINVSGEGPIDSSLLLADVINSDGEWDLDFLHTLVPVEIVEIIRAIPLSRNLQLTDSIFWAGSMDGSFTVRANSNVHMAFGEREGSH
ncbi:hypothetical protein SLEP1_g33394 [Rubroshorea leprosula]|uniref:Reverse transcriptase domain-containing protein n=1 Tax=Rubroshorea leprosula TaxID=152421 RepID=A0AAV5KGG3_9ROSI|nr:hypothetical protein SLEP1_g33394 [Rubroshorea leprosula]